MLVFSREEAKFESVTRRSSLASSRAYSPQQAAVLIRVILGVPIKLNCNRSNAASFVSNTSFALSGGTVINARMAKPTRDMSQAIAFIRSGRTSVGTEKVCFGVTAQVELRGFFDEAVSSHAEMYGSRRAKRYMAGGASFC